MPRAKRNKVVTLTKTAKKTKEDKAEFMEEVKECALKFNYAYLFSVGNMRNSYLKEVRALWKGSRLLYGRNKVIAKALGTTPEDECRPGLSQLTKRLEGNVGLLFTNEKPEVVVDWCKDYERQDFARAGNKASEDIVLPEGPILDVLTSEPLAHSLDPQLRSLGIPATLVRGVPSLKAPYTVCKRGETLKSQPAQILKLLNVRQARFRVIPRAYWTQENEDEDDNEGDDDDDLDGGEGRVVELEVDEADEELLAGGPDVEGMEEDADDEAAVGDAIGDDMMLPAGITA